MLNMTQFQKLTEEVTAFSQQSSPLSGLDSMVTGSESKRFLMNLVLLKSVRTLRAMDKLGARTVRLFRETLTFTQVAMRICRLNITTSACLESFSIHAILSQLSSHNIEDPLVLERLQGV